MKNITSPNEDKRWGAARAEPVLAKTAIQKGGKLAVKFIRNGEGWDEKKRKALRERRKKSARLLVFQNIIAK